jgi:hypothetical protein
VTATGRRRLLWGLGGTLAALAVLFGLFLAFGIDIVARRGIRRVVREALGAPVELGSVRLRLKGTAEIEDARIGNPGGYQKPVALDITRLDAYLDTDTLSGDVLVIRDMLAIRPVFTVEFLNGRSNVAVLVERLLEAIPADAPRFRIDRLRIREAEVRIHVPGTSGEPVVFHLPDLELHDFGDAPGTASTAHLLLAVFLQTLAGGAMEQEEIAFPEGLRRSFAEELKRTKKAIQEARRS